MRAKPHSGLALTRHTQREKMARTGVAKVSTPDSDSDDNLVVPPEPVKVLTFIFQGGPFLTGRSYIAENNASYGGRQGKGRKDPQFHL